MCVLSGVGGGECYPAAMAGGVCTVQYSTTVLAGGSGSVLGIAPYVGC